MKFDSKIGFAAVFISAVLAGCASDSTYKQELAEREAEIQALREERTAVKNENRDLHSQNQTLDKQLQEANAKLIAEPVQGTNHPELDAAGVGYGTRDGMMVISLPQEITFASGKADLTQNGRKALTVVSKLLLKDYKNDEYWIEGHTDSDPVQKSKFGSNRDLSVARAMAVLRFLVEDTGVPDGQCVVSGWGEYRPVEPNNSAGNKAKNRRVEIVVHKR